MSKVLIWRRVAGRGGYLGFCHAYAVECRRSLWLLAAWMKIYSGDCECSIYSLYTAGSLAPPWNVTNDSVQYIEFLLCRIKRARALHCWYFHSIMQRARVFSIYFINILSAALLDSIPNSIYSFAKELDHIRFFFKLKVDSRKSYKIVNVRDCVSFNFFTSRNHVGHVQLKKRWV